MRCTTTSLAVAVAVLLGLLLGLPAPAAADHALTRRPLGLPVDGPVRDGFDAPTTYGPGHRGVDLAIALGTPVVAVAPGVVTFAGQVAGARWVTVDHGWVRTTVGPLGTVAVGAGRRVTAGTTLGTSGRAHGLPGVHFSARVGERYVDPLRIGPPRVSLVPLDARRPAVAAPRRSVSPLVVRRGPRFAPGAATPVAVPRPSSASPSGAWRTSAR